MFFQVLAFDAHVTDDADVLNPGKVSLNRFPGKSVITNPLWTAVSVGLPEKTEVSTIPLALLISSELAKMPNLGFKTRVVNNDSFMMALSGSFFDLQNEFLTTRSLNIGVIGNHFFSDSWLSLGWNLSMNYLVTKSEFKFEVPPGEETAFLNSFAEPGTKATYSNGIVRTKSSKHIFEGGVDLRASLPYGVFTTIGFGQYSTLDSVAIHGEPKNGYGASAAIHLEGYFFSKPRIGYHYIPDENRHFTLISSTIY